jgi:hypothetical protein
VAELTSQLNKLRKELQDEQKKSIDEQKRFLEEQRKWQDQQKKFQNLQQELQDLQKMLENERKKNKDFDSLENDYKKRLAESARYASVLCSFLFESRREDELLKRLRELEAKGADYDSLNDELRNLRAEKLRAALAGGSKVGAGAGAEERGWSGEDTSGEEDDDARRRMEQLKALSDAARKEKLLKYQRAKNNWMLMAMKLRSRVSKSFLFCEKLSLDSSVYVCSCSI